MKRHCLLLNLFVAGILLAGLSFSAAPALALEMGYPGSSGQSPGGDYSWNSANPEDYGWNGTFGGEDPAGGATALARPKLPPPARINGNGWGGTFGSKNPAGEAETLSKPNPPKKPQSNGWGGTYGGEDPAGGATALARPNPPKKPQSNGWGGIFTGEELSILYLPAYQRMVKVY